MRLWIVSFWTGPKTKHEFSVRKRSRRGAIGVVPKRYRETAWAAEAMNQRAEPTPPRQRLAGIPR